MGKTDFDCKASRFYETEALTVYVYKMVKGFIRRFNLEKN